MINKQKERRLYLNKYKASLLYNQQQTSKERDRNSLQMKLFLSLQCQIFASAECYWKFVLFKENLHKKLNLCATLHAIKVNLYACHLLHA